MVRSRWVRALRRTGPFAVILTLVVTGAGCTGSSPDRSSSPDLSAPSTTPATPANGSPVPGQVDGSIVHRIGSGRAVAAAAEAETLLVATTAGVEVFTGDRLPVAGEAVEPSATIPSPPGGPVETMTLAPDGASAVLGTAEATQLWALGAGPRLLADWPGPATAAFVATGRVVVAWADEVKVVDVATAETLASHPALGDGDGTGYGTVVASVPGDWWLVPLVGGAGHRALWSADGGDGGGAELVDMGLPVELFLGRVVADPSARRVYVGLWTEDRFDGVVASWDPASGPAWSAPITSTEVWDARPGGGVVITDGVVPRLVDVDGTERALEPIEGDGTAAAVHALGPTGFVTVLHDGSRLVADDTGSAPVVLPGTGRPVAGSAVGIARSAVTLVDTGGTVEVVAVDGSTVGRLDRYAGGSINDVDLSNDGSLAMATSTGAVTVLDLADPVGAPRLELDHPEGNVGSVAFSPEGERLVTGVASRRSALSFDDTIAMWDRTSGSRTAQLGGESEDVPGCSTFTNVLRWAPDGSFVAGVSHDFTVFLIDGATTEVGLRFPPHAGPVLDMALSPDGARLVTSSTDSTLRIWDTASGDLVAEHQAALGGYRSLAFLPDGAALLAADLPGQVVSIDAITGDTLQVFESVKGRESQLVVSPDGGLAAAGDGSTVRVWSTATGRVVGQLDGHTGSVTAAAFTADGTGLIVGSSDGTAVVWDLRIGP